MKHSSPGRHASRASNRSRPLRWLSVLCMVIFASCSGYVSCGSNAGAEAVGTASPVGPAPQAPAPPAPATSAPPESVAPAPASPTDSAQSRRQPKLVEVHTPTLTGHVTDEGRLLDDGERSALETLLTDYERRTGHQFAVLTVRTLRKASAADFGFTVASRTGLGRRGKDDGLLITVSATDRAIDIQVGKGLDQSIPDALAARVIQEKMAPAFRSHHYASGLTLAAQELMRAGESVR